MITICTVAGCQLEVETHDRNDRWISRSIVSRGVWEPDETALIVDRLRPGDTFVDIGANIGWFTLIAARIVGESGMVIAYEPDPDNFAILDRNIARNGLTNVVAINAAFSTANARKALFRSNDNMGDHRLFGDESRESVTVDVVNPCFDWIRAGLRADFIKSDTQGHEGHVIRALMPYLMQLDKRPTILAEYWPKGILASGENPNEMVRSLYELGYRATVLPNSAFDVQSCTESLTRSNDPESHVNLVFCPCGK